MGAFSVLSSCSLIGRVLPALVLPLLLAFGGGAALAQQDMRVQQDTQAQRQQVQPGNNAPVLRDVRKEGQEHYTSVKGRETGVLIQTLGETWRELRNGWIVPIAGWLLVAAACVLGLFHWFHGPITLEGKPTGRLIKRFTDVQRVAHWSLAISFCILAVTGLIMFVGKFVLLPVIGHTLFSWLGEISKTLHNFIGPVFAASVLLMIVVFVKDSLPAKGDLKWLLRAGGAFEGKPTGRLIRRFSDVQRVAHWSLAISFCILAVTGLVMMVGKFVLLPVIGHTLFSWLGEISKNLHNFVGPVFAASVLLMIVVFVKHSLPAKGDLKWLLRAGGAFEGKHMPVGKHHAGHKVWFWASVVLMSTIISASGLVMDFPTFDQTRYVMIVVNVIHSVAAGILMALSLTHLYMGTVGVEGAYEGMRYGYVDETYAKEHHVYWYDDIKAGKIKVETAQGTPQAPQAAPALHGVGETT